MFYLLSDVSNDEGRIEQITCVNAPFQCCAKDAMKKRNFCFYIIVYIFCSSHQLHGQENAIKKRKYDDEQKNTTMNKTNYL